MIAWDTPIFLFLAVCCLVLNWHAFRGSSAEAGHGGKQKLKMAAIWLTIFAGLALLIDHFGG